MDVHSYHPQRQPDYTNHCGTDNGKCSHMCLPNNIGFSCVCPVGQVIKSDGKSCLSGIRELLIFTRKKDIRLMPLNPGARLFDTVIPLDHVQSAVGLTFDARNYMIYWTDVEANTISKAHLNGSQQQVVIGHNLGSYNIELIIYFFTN